MRGQAVVVLVGIIVLAVVVITVTWQALSVPSVPQAVKSEHETIEASLTNLIRAGASEVIKTMEDHGGYLSGAYFEPGEGERIPNAPFRGKGVAYWQECGDILYPEMDEVADLMAFGISRYLQENLNETEEVFGKRVVYDFDNLVVTPNIMEKQVKIIVNLPTEIEEHLVTKPYTTEVPTQFGEIYEFAKDFSEEEANERFWEKITSANIRTSPELPTSGMQFGCGDIIFLSPREVSEGLENEVMKSIVNLKLWAAEPPGPRSHNIEDVNGNQYENLDISFWLPSGFEVPASAPVVILNDELLMTSNIISAPFCLNRYLQTYSFTYSVIISVKDELLDSDFNFANFAWIDELEPGDCGDIMAAQAECADLRCSADITVENFNGNPIENAVVSFRGCAAGNTNFQGKVVSQVKCGTGKLIIAKEGYSVFTDTVSHANLNSTFVLNRVPELDIHFYRLGSGCRKSPVEDEFAILTLDGPQKYTLNTQDPEKAEEVDTCMEASEEVCEECQNTQSEDKCIKCQKEYAKCQKDSLTSQISVNDLSAGTYQISGIIMNPQAVYDHSGNWHYKPFVGIPIQMKPETGVVPQEDGSMVIYVPDMEEFSGELIGRYDHHYDRYKGECLGTEVEGYCLGEECDSDCAHARALAKVTSKIESFPNEFHNRVNNCLGGELIKRS